MEEKNISTEYLPDSYRTGDVQPPKNHRGIISLLLLLVIFAGSLVSVLSFWGVSLLQLLWMDANTPAPLKVDMRLSQQEEPIDQTQLTGLGVEGRFLSQFDQYYFDLPQGIYITQVHRSTGSIRTGDVLTGINQIPIADAYSLHTLLGEDTPGTALQLQIYRDGTHQTVTAVVE